MPKDLKALAETGVPLAATVKPCRDRKKMFEALEEIQAGGATWAGIEVAVGQGTKIRDQPIVADCAPITLPELKEVRKAISGKMILKGILSPMDAEKSIEEITEELRRIMGMIGANDPESVHRDSLFKSIDYWILTILKPETELRTLNVER